MRATPAEVIAIRQQLLRQGYAPLPLNGKAPTPKGWQQKLETNPAEIDLWGTMWPHAVNTGILCRFTPCLDIDILDPAAAAAVEALVRERFEDGGYVLTRFGATPKRAIPFRTQEPFTKIAVSLIAPTDDTSQKLEFLGDGQQVVVDGMHPDIGKPYDWFGKSLLDVPHDELPYIRAAEAQQLIDDASELLVAEHGYRRTEQREKKGNGEGPGEHIDWASLTSRIIAGQELHDNTRDLAASYIGSGMSAAHALRQLRALLLASSAAHDERWRERFDNLSRLVRGAEEKFGKTASGLGEYDAGDDVELPPPRGWLLANTFCRKFISSLLGDGGVGKTALRYVQYLALATNRLLTGEHVFRRCRVLIISLEDDVDELRRRILAARIHHGIDLAAVKGWLFYSAIGAAAGKLMVADKSGARRGQLVANIEATVAKHNIDLVAIDPFVKSHAVPENENSMIDEVMQVLTDVAAKYDIAVDIPHHVSKGGPAEPGNANRGRGATAMIDAGRLVYTLTTMGPEEAQIFGIAEVERKQYVRVDSGKVNLFKGGGTPKWFRLIGVRLDNGNELYPNGDEVQTVVPWKPPEMWTDLNVELLNEILAKIDAGLPDGNRFSDAPRVSDELAAWRVITDHAPNKTEGQAREIIRTWVNNGVLTRRGYHNTKTRKNAVGLHVDHEKRPS